jgi:hypothetical protein
VSAIKTAFARGSSPFAPQVKKPARFVDPESLTIANDPIQATRTTTEHKYEGVFSKMKSGQCLVCASEDAGKIGHALNTWLKRTNREGVVRTTKHYAADGKGRVWLIVPDKKLKVAA